MFSVSIITDSVGSKRQCVSAEFIECIRDRRYVVLTKVHSCRERFVVTRNGVLVALPMTLFLCGDERDARIAGTIVIDQKRYGEIA